MKKYTKHMMLSNSIIESDKFLDLPLSTRFLYIYLNSQADGMGFIVNKKAIVRTLGLDEEGNDYQLLIDAGLLIEFKQSGVICIKHWHSHNTDLRKKTTDCAEEFEQLEVGQRTGEYFFKGNVPEIEQKPAYEPKAKEDAGTEKNETDQAEEQTAAEELAAALPDQQGAAVIDDFVRPTVEEVRQYFGEQNLYFYDWKDFFDEFSGKDWKLSNGERIKSWKNLAKSMNKKQEDFYNQNKKSDHVEAKASKQEQKPTTTGFKSSASDQPAEEIKGGYDALEDADFLADQFKF